MSSEHTAQSERNVESENRSHFDKTAASYDAVPGALGLAATAGKGIRDHYPSWNPQKTRVMEFASGTGALSLSSFFAPMSELCRVYTDITFHPVQVWSPANL